MVETRDENDVSSWKDYYSWKTHLTAVFFNPPTAELLRKMYSVLP